MTDTMQSPTRSLTRSLLLGACLLTPLPAQQLAEGHRDAVRSLPPGSGNVLHLPDGGIVWFTGTDLVLEHHGQTRTLLSFAAFTFGSFTVPAGSGHLLFGESSTGDVWLVPLRATAQPRVLANLPFNYDAVEWGPGRALVSAKTTGFGTAHNDVVVLDLHTGTIAPLLRVAGASGPVEVDGHGNLYYATSPLAFPPPPGSADVLRWDAAVLQAALGGPPLTEQHARVVATGLDAASDLALDGDDDLFFVDWWNATIGELSDVGGGAPRRSVLLAYGSAAVTGAGLQFVGRGAAPGQPSFEPFQPDGGGALLVHESAFGGPSQVRAIEARRPQIDHTGGAVVPAGPFELVTAGASTGGLALFALRPTVAGHEVGLSVPGFEQTLFWDVSMSAAFDTYLVAVDGAGVARLPLVNPGLSGGMDGFVQVAMVGPGLDVIGSAAVHAFRLAGR